MAASVPNKSIVVITAAYPYGIGEVFMDKEIEVFSNNFAKVYIFPQFTKGNTTPRKVPENCEVILTITDHFETNHFDILRNFPVIVNWFFIELFYSGKFFQVIFKIRSLIRSMLQIIHKAKLIESHLSNLKGSVFYSVWMDDGALLFSFLKRRKIISEFSFRLHGYDLFDERRKGNYMPFRIINFRAAKKIFILSEFGKKYLLNGYPEFERKYIVNYSGLPDNGINPTPAGDVFNIVSCSNVIPLKNVDKIARVVGLLDFPTTWFHFGSGSDFDKVSRIVETFPEHINCKLFGAVKNSDVIDFYKKTPIDLFIHLSSSEGLGMAIVEAQSFGIPVLVADAQGTSETFNNCSGILVDVSSSEQKIAQIIIDSKNSQEKMFHMRIAARSFYLAKFKSPDNYVHFINQLIH